MDSWGSYVEGIIQIRKPSCIYHIPHFTINWAHTTRVAESWDVSSIVMSYYVCGFMISTGAKSVVCLLLGLVLLRYPGMCPSVLVHIHPHKSSPMLVIEN